MFTGKLAILNHLEILCGTYKGAEQMQLVSVSMLAPCRFPPAHSKVNKLRKINVSGVSAPGLSILSRMVRLQRVAVWPALQTRLQRQQLVNSLQHGLVSQHSLGSIGWGPLPGYGPPEGGPPSGVPMWVHCGTKRFETAQATVIDGSLICVA